MIFALAALLIAGASHAQPQQSQPPQSQPPQSQPPQSQPMPPNVPPPQTPGTPQPPRTQPPAEQIPAPTPTPAQPDQTAAAVPPKGDVDHSTALMLLDRMQTLVDDALSGKQASKSSKGAVGTTGVSGLESSGKVSVDRAMLAELRSEIAQIRMMLQR
jgi:hypothetical protein